jgi:YHS domain-containing protein
MVTDPMCGTSFEEEKAGENYDFQEYTQYFCSSACRDKFLLYALDFGGCGE